MKATHEDFRNVDRSDKVKELEDIWKWSILEERKWRIREIFGKEAADRYQPMMEEKDFFIMNGRLPHPEDFRWPEESDQGRRFFAWNTGFWEECKRLHPEKWELHKMRREDNEKKWRLMPGNAAEEKKETELEAYIKAKLQ